MTEQQLDTELETLFVGAVSKHLSRPERDKIKKFCKAYAASELAAKDAEIAALAELLRLKETFDPTEYHKDLIRGYKTQRTELQAEIKRLRDVVNRAKAYCEYGNGCGGATRLPNGKWFDEGDGTLYHAVLSALSPSEEAALEASDRQNQEYIHRTPSDGEKPEPNGAWIGDMDNSFDKWLRILKKTGSLTIREDDGKVSVIQSTNGFYESPSFGNYDLNDVIDWVSTHGGLEFFQPSDGEPMEAPAPEILCPKCGGHRLEKIGVGINAGTVFKCLECRNEWENEPVDFETPAPEEYTDVALNYALSHDEETVTVICDRCETLFDDAIHTKCPACGCIDFRGINEEEE